MDLLTTFGPLMEVNVESSPGNDQNLSLTFETKIHHFLPFYSLAENKANVLPIPETMKHRVYQLSTFNQNRSHSGEEQDLCLTN